MKSCLAKILVVFVAGLACAAVAYYWYSKEAPLPVLRPSQLDPILVDESVAQVQKHRVAGFSLLDQRGGITDSTFTKGRIHVADFFFTTCQTICPIMSGKMAKVAEEFSLDDDVRFLSFSVIPEEDSVPVLADYAKAYEINELQWRLLTGDKEEIYRLARTSYFTLKPTEAGQGDGGVSDFIHTNNFVLVDDRNRIRGYYDGTSDRDMEQLSHDIERLLELMNP